jgi:SAM-dependent methyltransferase
MSGLIKKTKSLLAAPPVPFLVTSRTTEYVQSLIDATPAQALILNVGAGYTDYGERVTNIDIFDSGTTHIIASALELPFADECADLVILQGVLEHVQDAAKTLQECFRVMKKGSLFYTEMPFLQPYHESPIDLRRCTRPGLNEFCHPLTEVESGIHIGPASTVTWILREFLAILLSGGNPRLYSRINSLVGWVVFPLKYADYWLEKRPGFHRIASSCYYVGRK